MNHKLPPIGMRMIKSAIGVFIGFVIYFIRGCNGTPFYTALSVLWCMRPYVNEAKIMAKQRTMGTLIGGVFGLIMIFTEHELIQFEYPIFLRYVLISIVLIPVLYTTVFLNMKNASYFACVVYLSIVVVHITDENPYLFVFNRVLDTLIGVLIGLLVNTFTYPKKFRKDILFVSGIDDTLICMNQRMTNYSMVELNRMIDEGAKFTISSMWTPASIVEELRGIRLKLPVIAMDGAVLYDIEENRYLKKFEIAYLDAIIIKNYIDECGVIPYINVVHDDMWAIYYDGFCNEVQEKIYVNLRKSPYRNYINSDMPFDSNVVYFMLIETDEKIQHVYEYLKSKGIADIFKIKMYPSDEYKGYSYMKIYHRLATREHMLSELMKITGLYNTVTFGSAEGKCDIRVNEGGADYVVKTMKRLYEVPIWR